MRTLNAFDRPRSPRGDGSRVDPSWVGNDTPRALAEQSHRRGRDGGLAAQSQSTRPGNQDVCAVISAEVAGPLPVAARTPGSGLWRAALAFGEMAKRTLLDCLNEINEESSPADTRDPRGTKPTFLDPRSRHVSASIPTTLRPSILQIYKTN